MKNDNEQAVILIDTADRKGLVAEITMFFFSHGFNILKCQQYADLVEERYFMRLVIDLGKMTVTKADMEAKFKLLADRLELNYSIYYSSHVQRVAVLCSRASHCVYDLLMHQKEGDLKCEMPLVISNHRILEDVAGRFDVPFFTLPVTPETRSEQEARLAEMLRKHRIDLIVLARYMQILSDGFISGFPDRIINIHHAFLPAFQGGNPYLRAWERGVKMIGATAHYATADLDEGPIIEQDVERITHEATPDGLRDIGKDIERRVLTRAVRADLEHRVIISGKRTIVFPR